MLVDLARVVLAAEAVGPLAECTDMAARIQGASAIRAPDRDVPSGEAPLRQHGVKDRAGDERSVGCSQSREHGRRSALLCRRGRRHAAGPAADLCANLNTQVHGGIAITWEHDAHLFMRRATVLLGYLDPEAAAIDLTDPCVAGDPRQDRRAAPEAEAIREEVRAFADSIKGKSESEQRDALIKSGYVMPHWPRPYGREAGAVEQLVVEQEFAAAGIARPGTASRAGSSSP